ncbi:MAG TPA: hypothetical protein VF311_04090 [Terriglobales bacterium]|jgi:hypothetical protein
MLPLRDLTVNMRPEQLTDWGTFEKTRDLLVRAAGFGGELRPPAAATPASRRSQSAGIGCAPASSSSWISGALITRIDPGP